MRAVRQQSVLEVVRCGTKPSSRVRSRAPPVQHLLRGGYKRGLHAFQGGQTYHGRFGTPEDAKSRGTRDNAVRLRHVKPACVPLRHAAPSPPQVLDSLHGLVKAQARRPLDFLSGHAYQDGK